MAKPRNQNRKLPPSAAAKGGLTRAQRLTPERRAEIGRSGALVRWTNEGKTPPVIARWGAPERPLHIGEIEIPCYVLADTRRVLSQRGLHSGIGMSSGGGPGGARKMAAFLRHLSQKGLDVGDLIVRADSPIRFIPPHGGKPAEGYEASILPDICAAIIAAGQKGMLHKRLEHLAERAALLQHGFATVGIIALVDEATGYQDVRARDALAKILERFVAKDLKPWVKTFPADFYQQIFRLNGWKYTEDCGRPGVVGHWTNNIVYRRLAPGVWEELKRVTPRTEAGRPKTKLFQFLTEDVGHPKLLAHLSGVVMLMKYSPDWQTFMDRIDKEFPQWGTTLMLPFPDGYNGPDANA